MGLAAQINALRGRERSRKMKKIFAGYYGEAQCFECRGINSSEEGFDPEHEYDRVEEIDVLFPSQRTKLRRRVEDALRKCCPDSLLVEIAEQLNVKTIDI